MRRVNFDSEFACITSGTPSKSEVAGEKNLTSRVLSMGESFFTIIQKSLGESKINAPLGASSKKADALPVKASKKTPARSIVKNFFSKKKPQTPMKINLHLLTI